MGRREENKLQKRNRIESEGLNIFLEHGYDRASIEQIVAAADVARGTFYLYFPDKLTLFQSLVDIWLIPLLTLCEQVEQQLHSAKDRSSSLIVYLNMASQISLLTQQHREQVLLVFRELRRVGEAGDHLRSREVEILDAATRMTALAASKQLITVEDPRLTANMVIGAAEKLHYAWLIGEPLGDSSTLAIRSMLIFARMLGLPPKFNLP